MMKNSFIHTPLRVLLVGSNFCRKNEPRDAYGASCLVSAFRNSPTNAGDTLDVLPPDGYPFLIKCQSLINAEGESVDSAPHPMEILTMTSDKPVPAGSVIRRKRD